MTHHDGAPRFGSNVAEGGSGSEPSPVSPLARRSFLPHLDPVENTADFVSLLDAYGAAPSAYTPLLLEVTAVPLSLGHARAAIACPWCPPWVLWNMGAFPDSSDREHAA